MDRAVPLDRMADEIVARSVESRSPSARPRAGAPDVRRAARGDRLSLTGNLEDLPLLDILQIVSFSKKTGYLAIHAAGRRRRHRVPGRPRGVPPSPGTACPLDPPRRQRCPRRRRDRLLRKRIEIALEQLIRLREGEFNFSLTETTARARGGARHPGRDAGRAASTRRSCCWTWRAAWTRTAATRRPRWRRRSREALAERAGRRRAPLRPSADSSRSDARAAAGRRGRRRAAAAGRERSRPADAARSPPARPLRPPARWRPRGARRADAGAAGRCCWWTTRRTCARVLAEHFTRGRLPGASRPTDPDAAVKTGRPAGQGRHAAFMLVTDLGMPTSGGSSFHGGFEVVKRLWKMNLQPPVLMMTESLSTAPAGARARQMGISELRLQARPVQARPASSSRPTCAAFARSAWCATCCPAVERRALRAAAGGAPADGGGASAAAGPAPSGRAVAPARASCSSASRSCAQRGEATQISLAGDEGGPRVLRARPAASWSRATSCAAWAASARRPAARASTCWPARCTIPLSASRRSSATWSSPAQALRGRAARRQVRSQHLLGKVGRFRSDRRPRCCRCVTHRETIAVLFGDNPETRRAAGAAGAARGVRQPGRRRARERLPAAQGAGAAELPAPVARMRA